MKPTTLLIASLALGSAAFAGDNDKKTIAPPAEDSWQFKLSMPGWVPWLQGDTGVNGQIAHIDLGPDNLVPKIDMAADIRMEAHKGRLSVLGEFFYMSISDGIGTNTAVKKLDVQVDQTMGDLAVAWRLIDSPRGYLDVVAGVRYTNFYQKLVTQADAERIDAASTRLVDAVSDRVATALTAKVVDRLTSINLPEVPELGHPSTLPIAPIGGRLGDRLRERIQEIINARKVELAAAVQARKVAVGAAVAAAQQRVDSIKKDLSKKIAREVESKLDTRVSRTDDWWDPYIGVRARYNLNDKFYVTGKADIGGFGVGCDITWTAEAALGWKLSERIYSEIGYRALGVDYDKDGLVMDTVTHGPQVTLGIIF